LGELITVFRGGLWTIMWCALAFLLLAGLYAWRATPIYRIDALVKVDTRQGAKSNASLEGRLESFFDENSQAQTELEILQSNTVLGRAAQAARLDLAAVPEVSLKSPAAWGLGRKADAAADIETFNVPDRWVGVDFTLVNGADGTFTWAAPDGQVLSQGRPGDVLRASWQGSPLELKVGRLTGKAGQRFKLHRAHIQDCIDDLRSDLAFAEKGKETNVLSLVLEYPDPQRGVTVLNAILDQYGDLNIDQKSAEAAQTLAFVRQQMSLQRDKLMRSEQQLDQVRAGRSVDLGEEARLVLSRSSELDHDILALLQKKDEMLRTYQERSDVVLTLNQQIAQLQQEKKRLEARSKSMPQTQQEVLRLMREVQVNQDQYAALMNLETLNMQQLQMAKAGGAWNSLIIDRAMASVAPVKPKKGLVLALGLLVGLLAGGGLVLGRHSLSRRGIKDPQVLEAQFGLPVLATIPHSENQDLLNRRARRKDGQHRLLAASHPDDLAVESLRSLRTSLHFTLVDTPNKAILVAGASPDIGKTFVGANFAIVLAQYGARVLLVDADMRRGKLHHNFGAAQRQGGLSEVLAGRLPWYKALHHAHGVDMLSTGALPPDPARLLAGSHFGTFMAEVCEAYDYVILDAPPILAVTDAVIIGSLVGSVLLLVKDGQHPLGEIRAALQCLDIAGIQPKGFIFNEVTPLTTSPGLLNYTYYYAYQKPAE